MIRMCVVNPFSHFEYGLKESLRNVTEKTKYGFVEFIQISIM